MELKPCNGCGRTMPVERTAYGKTENGRAVVEVRRTFLPHYSDPKELRVCVNSDKPVQERSVQVRS